MSKLPRDLPARKIISALEKIGFSVDRVTGSHYILKKDNLRVVVPYHKNLRVGTLKSILNQAEISIEEFQEFL